MEEVDIIIDSQPKIVGTFKKDWTQSDISSEPMLFNCDREHAYKLGGPITRAFLEDLPMDWQNCPIVIETLSHKLRPDSYPYISGWHVDDRVGYSRLNTEIVDGSPQWCVQLDPIKNYHIIGLVNANASATEFAIGTCHVKVPKVNEQDYKPLVDYIKLKMNLPETCDSRWPIWHLHFKVQHLIDKGLMTTFFAPDASYVEYDDKTFHRTTKATKKSWRWFARICKSKEPDGYKDHVYTNEIWRTSEIYIGFPDLEINHIYESIIKDQKFSSEFG
jgi:hypothetical protein